MLSPLRLFMLLAALCLTPALAQDNAREIVIGYVAPLDDPDAFSGAEAAQMAFDEINLGQPRIAGAATRFRLLVQSDKADPRIAEHVARYLVKTEAAAVIGHWTSTTSITVAPIYTEAGIAQLAPISWSKLFAALPGNSHFQGVGTDDKAMLGVLEHLRETLHITRVMVIDDSALLGVAMADSFEKYAKRAGLQVLRQSVSTQTSDFNAPLQQARQFGPDLILFTGRGAQSAAITRNLKRLGINAKLLLTGPVVSAEFLAKTGHSDEELFAIVPGLPRENRGRMEDFRKRYVERFKREPAPFAMFAYDCAYAMAAAIRKADSSDRKRIVAALHDISYVGLTGAMAFNADGTLKNPVYTLYQTDKGRWVVRKAIKTQD